jgi:hypothetical protein
MPFFAPLATSNAASQSSSAQAQAASAPPRSQFFAPLDSTSSAPPPTPAEMAAAQWNKPAPTLSIGPWDTHIPNPKPIGHFLTMFNQGVSDVGTGLKRAGQMIMDPRKALADQAKGPSRDEQVASALEDQHPGWNLAVRWPTMLAASAPLGEGVGALAGRALGAAPEAAGLLTRALYAAPKAAARGAAYGVQQPSGDPRVNAAVGALAGPVLEGAASSAGKALQLGGDALGGAYRRFVPRTPTQPEIDSMLSRRFAEQGMPPQVAPKPTAPGVSLTTAVHSGDPKLMALQAAERISGNATPFHELAASNNAAIVKGLQDRFAPNADSQAVSTAAHELLQNAQNAARGRVKAAYAPFNAVQGGVYLDRQPIQAALSEAYSSLLPAHQEMLPQKLQQVMESQEPLSLRNDVEDLSARLNDAYLNAQPHSTAARAATIMRDALNKGLEQASPVGVSVNPLEDTALDAWNAGKAANSAFRARFPQGTARDSEARQWLARRLGGGKEPTSFTTEALASPGRTQAVLNAMGDNPQQQQQMRSLLQNAYVNRLLSATREAIPGTRTLNADALTRARTNNSALEQGLFTPQERQTLDTWTQAAGDNQRILQRLLSGSSETAALRNYGEAKNSALVDELVKHGASAMHPAVGFLMHVLPALSAKAPDAREALQRTLTAALLNPEVYNRVAAAPRSIPTPMARLIAGLRLGAPTRAAVTRGAMVAAPRAAAAANSGP